MASLTSPEEIPSSILECVQNKTFPGSDDIAGAEVDLSVSFSSITSIAVAREDVKSQIRALSREVAPDVDSWISQSRQVQADIQRSKATARQIIRDAEVGRSLRAGVEDGSNKVGLLESEIEFNHSLISALENIKSISALLDASQEAALQDQITLALENLNQAEAAMATLGDLQNTRLINVLSRRTVELKTTIAEITLELWNQLFIVDRDTGKITIKQAVQRKLAFESDNIVVLLSKLDTLQHVVSRFATDFDSTILSPLLRSGKTEHSMDVVIEDDIIRIVNRGHGINTIDLLAQVHRALEYLHTRVPSSIEVLLAEEIVPGLASRIITGWLESSMATSLEDVAAFGEVVSRIQDLLSFLDEIGWPGSQVLLDWFDDIPRNWLAKRRATTLSAVRALYSLNIGERRIVERVETQTVSRDDDIMTGTDEARDYSWDAWNDDEEAESNQIQQTQMMPESDSGGEDANEGTARVPSNSAGHGDDEEESWGWDDGETDANENDMPPVLPAETRSSRLQTNGDRSSDARSTKREIILKERYTVTLIPASLIEIINLVISDADQLSAGPLSSSCIAPARVGLYSIPTLLLGMYRATASTFYSKDSAGTMLLYNDCTRIAEELTRYQADQPTASRLRVDTDVKAIEGFGRRSYGQEMEAQKTVLRDLLDGAQGFSNCTISPFAEACADSVTTTVDRIKTVYGMWKGILSHSVFVQSLGSLLATVTSKMIVEIEDLSDISEEESKTLHRLCGLVLELKNLFLQRHGGEERDMTALYSPNWLKFQYLSEILESSLADITYFWTDSELSLEFEVEEVVDLIEALFAESDYRRRSIAEIRRTSRR
ncbi:hypothetical protein M501DRAFT_993379 [Patellaria atrata CBS 101060]|uniref:ZW10 C-terminal helical domain-containing protein n=1 Tax=Patellaria atrata CBS 101060 TaxID=1346257 RepID=A0A9P4VR76_9PEZI|nr:hypothetical protein M501DRAFT_993379 [Patellaria atrata CBS 101060]